MASIGVADVGAAVVARPSLLGLDVDANLRKIVEYLQVCEWGCVRAWALPRA